MRLVVVAASNWWLSCLCAQMSLMVFQEFLKGFLVGGGGGESITWLKK